MYVFQRNGLCCRPPVRSCHHGRGEPQFRTSRNPESNLQHISDLNLTIQAGPLCASLYLQLRSKLRYLNDKGRIKEFLSFALRFGVAPRRGLKVAVEPSLPRCHAAVYAANLLHTRKARQYIHSSPYRHQDSNRCKRDTKGYAVRYKPADVIQITQPIGDSEIQFVSANQR